MPTRAADEAGTDLEPVLERRYALDMTPDITEGELQTERDPVVVALGRRVRAIREAQGRNQLDLAAASGQDRRYIGRVESGSQNTTLRALARIADALGVTLSHLFEGVPGYGRRLDNRPYERVRQPGDE